MSKLLRLGVTALLAGWVCLPAHAGQLRIGQQQGGVSFPFALQQEAFKGELSTTPMYFSRCQAFPSAKPLPVIHTELPDVIEVLVGYYDSDIKHLVDNDIIEPLDGLLDELELHVDDFPAAMMNAVRYQGHIWALPYAVDAVLLTYDIPTFKRLKLDRELKSWKAVFEAARVIASDSASSQGNGGFWGGRIGPALSLATFLSSSNNELPGMPRCNEALQLVYEYYKMKIFIVPEPAAPGPIVVDTFAALKSDSTTGVTVPPTAVAEGPNGPGPVLLKCFAIRKNSAEKKQSGVSLLRWLFRADTQAELARLSRLGILAEKNNPLDIHFFPAGLDVRETPVFRQLSEGAPEYRLMVNLSDSGHFYRPEGPDLAVHQKIVKPLWKTAASAFYSGNYFSALSALMQPMDEQDDPPQGAENAYSHY